MLHFFFLLYTQKRSPRILFANKRSLLMIVTLLAWIAQRLVSSNNDTKYDYDAYCRASKACVWNLISFWNEWQISLTSRWNGNLLIKRSVDFWYFLIYLKATVPGLNFLFFFTPRKDWSKGADFLANFWLVICMNGNFNAAVDLMAVYFVRTIYDKKSDW